MILYGPAGTGKTTLAHIIAATTKSEFVEVSAVTGTVKDLRREIEEAKRRLLMYDRRTILFIDEIHRFSRSQQDALLHAVENRTVVMIGATTENPYFEVNSALLSRGRVVELEHLRAADVERLVRRALSAPQGLDGKFFADDDVVSAICSLAAGDGRSALTTLELASEIAVTRPCDGPIPITMEDVRVADPRRGDVLRQVRRHALRHHLRLHQVHAGQRPRCRRVLARTDDRCRRGPEVHRPPGS